MQLMERLSDKSFGFSCLTLFTINYFRCYEVSDVTILKNCYSFPVVTNRLYCTILMIDSQHSSTTQHVSYHWKRVKISCLKVVYFNNV